MNKENWKILLVAAHKGNAEAQSAVGTYYHSGYRDEDGNTIIRRDLKKALAWYRRAANGGNAAAQNALGYFLGSGIGITKDDKQAIYWTMKAIEAGDSSAASNLATIYRDQENYKKAFHWFRRAVEMGDEDSLCELGQYYYFGIGCRRSPALAVQCFKKLIKISWPKVSEVSRQNAMYWLGIARLQGSGVVRSIGKAKSLFIKANKDNDHIPSHEMLLILGVEYQNNNKDKNA